ncbi:MAG: hypothetical protein JRJ44_06195 [Deltaproteobacteria bacterium]|nr:hypothetical protein [Deltaproteobacteria bacterium]
MMLNYEGCVKRDIADYILLDMLRETNLSVVKCILVYIFVDLIGKNHHKRNLNNHSKIGFTSTQSLGDGEDIPPKPPEGLHSVFPDEKLIRESLSEKYQPHKEEIIKKLSEIAAEHPGLNIDIKEVEKKYFE